MGTRVMKRNDIKDISTKLGLNHYENIFNVYSDSDNNYFFNILKKINVPDNVADYYYDVYLVEPGDTWTSIAYNKYGATTLWWIVCLANSVQNPINMPIPGTSYRLFKPEIVEHIINEVN